MKSSLRLPPTVVLTFVGECNNYSPFRVDFMDKGFKQARAQKTATINTIRLLAAILGKSIFVISLLLTVVLSHVFQLNALVVFAGAMLGSVLMTSGAIRSTWRLEFFMACQQEGLWDEAERMIRQDAGLLIDEIIAGKPPGSADPKLDAAISQAVLLFIRKGDLKKTLALSQYLLRASSANDESVYRNGTVSAMHIEMGNYEKGMDMALGSLDHLTSTDRKHSPAYVSGLFQVIHGHIALHKKTEAHKYLQRLKESIEAGKRNDISNSTDKLVRDHSKLYETDMAFYWLFLGRLTALDSDYADAEVALNTALDIMKDEKLQKRLMLMYPEILLALGEVSLHQGHYAEASDLFQQTAQYYDKRTIYRGIDYATAKAAFAYSTLKLGKGNDNSTLAASLATIESHVLSIHPRIATTLVWLAESHLKTRNFSAARISMERALRIRTTLFGDDDKDVRELNGQLAALSLLETTDGVGSSSRR